MRAIDLITSPVRGIINLLKNPIFQVGAVLGVSIGLKDTIETYKDFEAAMSQVQAISGATSTELVKLTNKAKEMGATTKFTAEESAQAFNYMAMAGWKTDDMLNGIEGILSLAAASGEDLATTSDIVTDALTAFNMKAGDAGHFSDVLAAAASNANTTVSGMGETFKYAGSMAGSLSYSIEDVALMTGLMANTGIKGTMAGTALNSIFTRLSTNTNGAADAMKDLGISFFDSNGQARDLSDVMGELRTATAGMTAEQKSNLANTIAGTQAQKGLLAILNASEEDYEATVALKLLTGTDADTSGLDSYYGSMKKQLDDLGKELSGKVDIALEDSVISLDESAEIQSLQDQISAITGKISQARTDAEFDTLKIKYSGAELDMDSFNALQEELQTQVNNASDQYEQALTLTLTNLNLQLADGAITQEEYDAAVKEATDGYYAQLNEINARVSSFNLETIAEAWDSSLQGYMPEIEGSTKEKLETALNNALLAHPDVQTWTAADVASWMGLDKLNLDTAVQTDIATQILQTALAVPDGTKEKIMQDFKDSVPTAEEIKEAIDWDSMTNEDWTELMESITGPTEGESIGLNTEDLKKKMSDYYGEYFESVKTSYSEALHNALENSGSEETLSTFMQQYMQDQMADFDFSTVMENYGPISNEYFATLQSEWQTAGTNLGTSLNAGASTSLTNGSAGLRTSLQTSLNTATASPFSISPTVNVTPKYNLLTLPTIPTTTSTPAKHAAGGRVGGGPQLSWLAEEGWDEFVIPTNPSRRTRALELYEQAGEALGVSKHAEGGRIEGSNLSDMVSDHNLFTEATRNASYGYNDTTEGNYEDNSAETFAPVSSEVPVSTPQTGPISVNVAVSPNFQIEAKEGQSEEDIVAVIRRHLGEIADELGGNIADKLSEVFANMPVSSTKGA